MEYNGIVLSFERAVNMQNEKNGKKAGINGKLTVIEKLKAYLDAAEITIKPSTAGVYHRYIRYYIEPYFKDMPYDKLTSDKMQQFIASLTESGLSAVTVQAIYSFLKSGVRPSGEDTIFDVSLPPRRKKPVEYLSRDEQKRLEEAAKIAGYPFYLAVLIGLYTGIRIGEMCGLLWEDIDFSSRIIRIKRTLQRIPSMDDEKAKTKIAVSSPKSPSSVRNIPIPGFLYTLLLEQQKNADCEYVLSQNGHLVEPRYIQNHFKKALKAANIRDVNFHTVRHTFATRALENNFDVKALSELLGHASATVTLDKYAHVLDDHKRKLMERMAEDCFSG
jgi:integrase